MEVTRILSFFRKFRKRSVPKIVILADPGIHADWLEERGELGTSTFLRRLAERYPEKSTATLLEEIEKFQAMWCGNDARQVIQALSASRELDSRRSRLFICWCCWRLWDFIPDRDSRAAVGTALSFEKGKVSEKSLEAACKKAEDTLEAKGIIASANNKMVGDNEPRSCYTEAYCLPVLATSPDPSRVVEEAIIVIDEEIPQSDQCDKIRELWCDSILALVDGSSW
jgi:hypothetical protein